MSWFNNLTSALGGSSSPAPAATNSTGNAGASVVSYGNDGKPTTNSTESSAPAGTTTNSSPAPSVVDLLFSPAPAPAPTNTPTNPPAPAPAPATNQQGGNDVEIGPGLTAGALMQRLGSVNFAQAVPQEIMTKALSGDVTSFSQILNSVAQMAAGIAVQQSSMVSTGLLDQRFSGMDSLVNNKVAETNFNAVLTDPKFSDPFIQPMAKDFLQRMRERDPSMTADQAKPALEKLINHALSNYSRNFTQPTQPTSQSAFPGDTTFPQPTQVKYDELFNNS